MKFENKIDQKILQRRERPREEDLRGYYFRDTTAIIHSYPFRRLKHKTQVFFSPKNDHICTRIEHVMHVATISATLCKALGLDVDMAWAISLGHDLGHAPFGHVGEKILDNLLKERGGRFIHELYSLRVVDHLVNYGKGLNLTYAVRDGIITHCGEQFEQEMRPDFEYKNLKKIKTLGSYPATWEGTVVRMADKVAYLGRDMEDAIQLKLIRNEDIPGIVSKRLGSKNSEIIDTLVNDISSVSPRKGAIALSDPVYEAVMTLKSFNYDHIYENPMLAGYHKFFERILTTLYGYLLECFEKYGFDFQKYNKERNMLSLRFADYLKKMHDFYKNMNGGFDNLVIDYIAGMTDDYAIDSIKEIMIPRNLESQLEKFMIT